MADRPDEAVVRERLEQERLSRFLALHLPLQLSRINLSATFLYFQLTNLSLTQQRFNPFTIKRQNFLDFKTSGTGQWPIVIGGKISHLGPAGSEFELLGPGQLGGQNR